jgi:ParB-like chromosome segregation protein Spo0J
MDPRALRIEGVDFPAGPSLPPGELDRLQLPLDEQLVDSIVKNGVLVHIKARKDPELTGRFQVVDGRRRVIHARAALIRMQLENNPAAATFRVPVDVMSGDDMMAARVARIANSFRKEDPPMTNAKNAKWFLDHGTSKEEIAAMLGVKVVTIDDWLSRLDLAPEAQDLLNAGNLATNAVADLVQLSAADQVRVLAEVNAEAIAKAGLPPGSKAPGKLNTAAVVNAAREKRGESGQKVKRTPTERINAAKAAIETIIKKHADLGDKSEKGLAADEYFAVVRKVTLVLFDKSFDKLVKAQLTEE